MDQLIALHIAIQARIPVFLWGRSGIGKTSTVKQIAEGLDEPLWPIVLSTREPSDQSGLPRFDPKGGVTLEPPRWALDACAAGHGIVFFDELNTSSPPLQASALRVVSERHVGDRFLPEAVTFVAAGNLPGTRGVYDLTAPMAARWVHLQWPLDHQAWIDGSIGGWKPPPPVLLPKGWASGIEAKVGLVASFIRTRPLLLEDEPEDPTLAGQAWPCPRKWTYAAVLLAAAASAGHDEGGIVARMLVEGCVGEGASREFFRWIANMDLRDPEEYLANPTKIPLPKRQDQVMAMLDGVASASLAKRKDCLDRYYAAWKVLGRVCREVGADVAIPAARALSAGIPPEAIKKMPPEMKDIREMVQRSGVDFAKR